MLASVLTTFLLVGVVGVFNAARVALANARHNRLESDLGRDAFGAAAALKLAQRSEELVAGSRVMVALLVVSTALVSGYTWLSYLTGLLGGVSALNLFIAYSSVVAALSFVVVVFGELLPSEIAYRHPELVARLLAPILSVALVALRPCAVIATRVVSLLLGPIKPEVVSDEDVEEDIRDLVDEGQKAGVIEKGEKEIIDRVFKLDDKPVITLMTPRADVQFLDREADINVTVQLAAESRHTWFPVRGDTEDDILGIVSLHDLVLVRDQREKHPRGILDILVEPLDVPSSISALKVLERFRESGSRFGIVRDEYGGISGIITMYDVLQVIAGDIGDGNDQEERMVLEREDGSFLVDAGSDVREVFETLGIADESPFNGAEFHSVGGYIMTTLGYVPREGERFEAFGYSFEVIDMDNKRIDKVLVSPLPQQQVVGS
jgi:putative hemolysin